MSQQKKETFSVSCPAQNLLSQGTGTGPGPGPSRALFSSAGTAGWSRFPAMSPKLSSGLHTRAR